MAKWSLLRGDAPADASEKHTDRPQVQSDVLSSLETIDTMFEACQSVLNIYTQATLMLAITTEAKMLQLKLQVMKDRWNYHLPFKEACTVDFYDWSKKVKRMGLWMTGSDEAIKRDQFIRLAERVVSEPEYGGPDAQKAASRYVVKLKNETPEDDWPRRREDDINASGDLISEMKYGGMVFRYLSHNYNIKGNYAGFGRFLNTFRKDITETDLGNLLEELFRILYLRDDKEQQEAAVTPQKPPLPKFFDKRLLNNPEAVEEYYQVLHHCGFFIGRTLVEEEKRDRDRRCYDGWKWKYLREALHPQPSTCQASQPTLSLATTWDILGYYLATTWVQLG